MTTAREVELTLQVARMQRALETILQTCTRESTGKDKYFEVAQLARKALGKGASRTGSGRLRGY